MPDTGDLKGISRLFLARSVAVVGASPSPEKVGSLILVNLIDGGFTGNIYPIHPKAAEIRGLKAYPKIGDVPIQPDLVIIAIPAPYVPGVLREAARSGVRAAIIISGGFREAGREDLEDELKEIAQQTGLRFLGPNCQGLNYRPNSLCASWPLVTTKGWMSIVSQSGTVAATLAGWAMEEGLGISASVSLGNQANIIDSDLLNFFSNDAECRSIALYLEGFKNGRRFLEVIRNSILQKPVVILKSGRTAGGQRAAASHTKSLAGKDEVFDAFCRQFGVLRAPDLETLYDCAKALGMIRICRGNRIQIITSSGGSGILAVDEAEREDLVVPPLPGPVIESLRNVGLPQNAVFSNPLDLTMSTAEDFEKVTSIISDHELADIYLFIFGDPIPEVTEVVSRFQARVGPRVAVSYLGGGEVEKVERVLMHKAGIPVFPTPERAIRAIQGVVWAARRQKAFIEAHMEA